MASGVFQLQQNWDRQLMNLIAAVLANKLQELGRLTANQIWLMNECVTLRRDNQPPRHLQQPNHTEKEVIEI
jgi:hypothetical protein